MKPTLIDTLVRGVRLEGAWIRPQAEQAAPAVIIFPSFVGRSENELRVAERLAGLGYAALAADLYGEGRNGATREECAALMQPLLDDRALLRDRVLAVLETVRASGGVDRARIAAIGYCFGGLCALDLARSGAELNGVASFHGLFTPSPLPTAPIKAKVIAFHGWDDPMAPPEQVVALGRELGEAKADWQLHAYGGVMHGFTNPAAAAPDAGVLYDASADRRSWAALEIFLAELFA